MEEFDENHAQLEDLKQLVDWDRFSDYQKYILYLKMVQKLTQRKLIEKVKTNGLNLSFESLNHCLLRSSLSLSWEPGMSGGKDSYLCPQDTESLEIEVVERCRMSNAFDSKTITEFAAHLKLKRYEKASKVLNMLQCTKKAEEIAQTMVYEPSRSWVNGILENIDSKLAVPLVLESKRFMYCSRRILQKYHHVLSSAVAGTVPALIWTADETMIDLNRRKKVIIPDGMRHYFEEEQKNMQHITAMCCNNLVGVHPPLFIILKNRKTMPEELKPFVATGKIWLCSTENGWMNRWAFLLWTIHFVPWELEFEKKLSPFVHNVEKPVLIFDGHNSRGCPVAIDLYAIEGIKPVVLPSHTTHVTQLYDVALAGATKAEFTDIFYKLLRDESKYVTGNNSATLRKFSVQAFVEAWDRICTKTNCENGAALCGIHPLREECLLNSKWVMDPERERIMRSSNRLREEWDTELDISCSLLTARVESVRNAVSRSARDHQLAKHYQSFESFQSFVEFAILEARKHNVFMLGTTMEWHGIKYQEIINRK